MNITFKDVKEFLNFNDEFWNYVNNRITRLESSEMIYAVLMHFDKSNRLDKIAICVPNVVDLKTALINVHEFKHAYDLYNMLGKEIDESNPKFESDAKSLEEEFKNIYLSKKKLKLTM